MSAKKIFKITFITVASIITISLVIAFLTLVSFLPSPKKIAQALTPTPGKAPAQKIYQGQTDYTPTKPEKATVPADSFDQKNENTSLDKSSKTTPEQAEKFRKMLAEDPRDLRVCRNLGRSKAFNKDNQAKGKVDITDFFSDEMRQDSVVEPFRFAVRKVFQDEAIAPLMQEILDMTSMQLSDNERDSFLSKMNFYSRAAYAAGNLYAKRSSFEELGNRAQHLTIIAQIAALKPELANDANISSFCSSLENSIADSSPVDIKEERKEILKLISYAGLTPKDLGFDPDSYIKFRIKNNEKGLNFTLSSKEPEPGNQN